MLASGTTRYGYDNASRPITATLPNGVTTSYAYDNANRLTRLSYTTGGGSVTLGDYQFAVDAMGNRTAITETVQVAGMGAALRVVSGTLKVLLPWVSNGAQPTIQSTQNPILLPFLSNGGVGQSEFRSNPLEPAGREPVRRPFAVETAAPQTAAPTKSAVPNQAAATKTATPPTMATLVPGNRRGEPLTAREAVRGGLLPRGVESMTETTTISYSYDPLSRVTGASYSGTLTNSYAYAYDAVGNRTVQTQTITSTLVTSYGYDNANRLTSVNAQTYTWDDNGNLLNDGAQTYVYDQANRLKQATQGANTYTFGYNGMGDRLSQTVGITTTRYVLDPAAGLTQVLADGTNTYLYGNARLGQYQASMQYFGADGLGSVRQIYDSSGQVVGSARYDPYGSVLAQSGAATSAYGFTGEWTDTTALTYIRARYYSSAQGRFTTRDVWEGEQDEPLTLNAWSYVKANPITFTDPSGWMPRAAGVCPEPPSDHTSYKREYFTVYFDQITFVYCGDFYLSAYQFISSEDKYNNPPEAVAENKTYKTSSLFIADIGGTYGNGTGRSSKVCAQSGGYFTVSGLDNGDVPTTFTGNCGKGREFVPHRDEYKFAATDHSVLRMAALLYIPALCRPDQPCQGEHAPRLDLMVADSGGKIKNYRIDVWTGEGPGRLSTVNNNPSSEWNRANAHMDHDRGQNFRGPTAVYQMVFARPEVVFPSLGRGGSCFGPYESMW